MRIDIIESKKAILTYSISNEFRGEGLGYRMLKLLLKKIQNKKNIFATVHKTNLASKKIFEKLKFSQEKKYNNSNYLSYHLQI